MKKFPLGPKSSLRADSIPWRSGLLMSENNRDSRQCRLPGPLRAASDESGVDPFSAALRPFGWPVQVLKTKNSGSQPLSRLSNFIAHTKSMENKLCAFNELAGTATCKGVGKTTRLDWKAVPPSTY
jgi:hypothetical protein